MTDDEDVWLTYREAGKRVRRSTKTIKRWRRNGMQMRFDRYGRRVVAERVLLEWLRGRLLADPVHQARLRSRGIGME